MFITVVFIITLVYTAVSFCQISAKAKFCGYFWIAECSGVCFECFLSSISSCDSKDINIKQINKSRHNKKYIQHPK